jgi:uncharacterized protein (TIGR00296 family)
VYVRIPAGLLKELYPEYPIRHEVENMFSDEEGRLAVATARAVVDSYVRHGTVPDVEMTSTFSKKGGVFVTLSTHPGGELRGCIGYPEPAYRLADALKDSAVSAAARDPRFPPVTADELDLLTIEVSLLTPPLEIEVDDPSQLPSNITVGQDGLIVESGSGRGLLLPQVPVEWGWDAEEFLSQTCLKAGLRADAWLMPGTKVFEFQGEVFSEERPRGAVVRRNLSE